MLKSYIAKTLAGLEEILATELKAIQVSDIVPGGRSVAFSGTQESLYKANYLCRTALRILKPLRTFTFRDQEDFYLRIKNIHWENHFSASQTFSIASNIHDSIFSHSLFVSHLAKDAIVDRFRETTGVRPSVATENPNFPIDVHIRKNRCTVSLDSSGESLHKRGYRRRSGEAPLNECLAAGMILLTGWDQQKPLIDPMCGSGTILTEAALIATNTPAGFFRNDYAFMNWSDFDRGLWDKVRMEANNHIQTLPGDLIRGFDISAKAISQAERNLQSAGFFAEIILDQRNFHDLQPPAKPGLLILNPPYDQRLPVADIQAFFRKMGDDLKSKFQGYETWIISPYKQADKMIGLHPSRKITLFNGPIECRFSRFDLYQGSKKRKKQVEME
ncbi:MAG: class I SAM-dependent RNA methyltransferase [Bacteroidetes bacterium]|nr:class I SAM-dependent RNA methyltransferase [Bacteroidota bacterium]